MRKLRRPMALLLAATLTLTVAPFFVAIGCAQTGQGIPEAAGLYPAYRADNGSQRWGYINARGRFVIRPTYDWAGDFGPDGLAIVAAGDRYGVIDTRGRPVVAPAYEFIERSPMGGTLIAREGSKYRVLNSSGAGWIDSAEPITRFCDGLSPFARVANDGDVVYGYVTEGGVVAIEPHFASASDFSGSNAVVCIKEGRWGIIDASGKLTTILACEWAGNLAEGLLVFSDPDSDQYGYASTSGAIVIPPQFSAASQFINGLAVVEVMADSEGYRPLFGLVDRQGRYVIAPQYASLQPIGCGLYAAGQPAPEFVPEPFTLKALVDRTGKQLTAYMFYDIGEPVDGRICVTDFTSTFFIDATGARLTDTPTCAGSGSLSVSGRLVTARIDGDLLYVTTAGRVVWQADDTQELAGGVTVITRKYRPNRSVLAAYPEVAGNLPEAVRDSLNTQLKTAFIDSGVAPGAATNPADFTESVTVGFSVQRLGNLLIVHRDGYVYPIGAAHGMPLSDFFHYDLTNARQYSLSDLFRAGSPYTARLTPLVRAEMARDSEAESYWLDEEPAVRADQPFTVSPDGLVLYYYPYEVAPYVMGFPTFTIPWTEIADIINTRGAFWRAMGIDVR